MAISGPVAHGLSIGPVCALPRHHKVGRARTLSPPGARGRAGVLSSRRNRMRISVTSQAALLDHGGSVTAPPLQMLGAKKPQRGERPALWRAALALSVLIDLDGSGSIPRRATGHVGKQAARSTLVAPRWSPAERTVKKSEGPADRTGPSYLSSAVQGGD